ncbi:hypothetical protein G3N59_35155 [Paraburkholderia sp. Ac-20340]|uniref:hypothetical protein n=1 Tax=Paraburkholderia sp. Ac-20340 TaxID=2703888 RepID=UPI00197F9D6F|nr:hypothetical protein [Paraburkholderia sp. Ac-20340]MBN3858642.1 hypothetical protein [Paraburkholderia sp. Ac-20340]
MSAGMSAAMGTAAVDFDYGGQVQVLAHALHASIDHEASMPRAQVWVVHLPNIDPDATLLLRFSPPEAAGRLVVESVLALNGAPVLAAEYPSIEMVRACGYRRAISLSLSKKANRLAEDIKVRLMPGYIDVLERIRAARRLGDAQPVRMAHVQSQMQAPPSVPALAIAQPAHGFLMPRLLASIGLHSTEWTGHSRVALPRLVTGGPQIDVAVDGEQSGTVHLSIRDLPLERAQAVLQLICELR